MGNILFLIGITLLLGPQRTFVFFARKNKWRGTLAFWAGVLLILMRWPLIGFGVELFGIFVLFGVCCSCYDVVLGIFGERYMRFGADMVWMYRSSSRRSQDSRTISRLLGLTWLVDCRLRETRLARTKGRTRICLYRKRKNDHDWMMLVFTGWAWCMSKRYDCTMERHYTTPERAWQYTLLGKDTFRNLRDGRMQKPKHSPDCSAVTRQNGLLR
jgi:hypothetical protein